VPEIFISKINNKKETNMAGYPNAARSLVSITPGVDYTLPAVYASGTTYSAGTVVSYLGTNYVSLVGSNTGNTPSSKQAFWAIQPNTAGYLPQIFCLLCTGTASGSVVLRAVNDAGTTTIPGAAFVVGQEYNIYLAELVSAPAGVTFVGYR
jgi:hypothetical protein